MAVGGRPRYLEYLTPEENHLCITSDDIFKLDHDPGKTLIVGGGYIAVECASFLSEMGNEVIMINRSDFLKAFDNDFSDRIITNLQEGGVKALKQTVIKSIKQSSEVDDKGRKILEVELLTNGDTIRKAKVNTVLLAVGREPNTQSFRSIPGLNFTRSNKVIGTPTELERTSVPGLYAVGDIVEGIPELMPVAQKSGKKLAHRLAAKVKNAEETIRQADFMDYNLIPTTIFSKTEYSCVGLSEEEAIKKYGEDKLEVYHKELTPLE